MDSPEKTQQETGSESLGDILEDTYDKMDAAEEAEESTEVEETAEAEGAEEETVETAEEGSEEKTEEVDEELKDEIQEAADSDYNEPAPERWPEELRESYNKLPPEARKTMLEGIYKPMQRSYTEATQQLAQMRASVDPVLKVMEQYAPKFQDAGLDPNEVLRTQMAWAVHLQTVGAEQGLADMAQAYGVGSQQKTDGQGNEYLTPTERALKEQLTELQNQVRGQQQYQQTQTQRERQNQQLAYQEEIRNNLHSFINEKTEDGKLKHPHMQKVASNIAGVLRGGLIHKTDEYGQPVPIRDQLAQAYTMACNLDPSIRTPHIGERQAQRVKAAQKVGVVTTEPAGHVTDADELPISSFIEKTYDQLDRRQ